MRFAHQTALVTGASQGLGKAIALRLGQEGCTVVLHYHPGQAGADAEAQAVAAAIRDAGGAAHLLAADLRDVAQCQQLGEQAWEAVGGLDILVNNAGVSFNQHFLDVTPADFAALADVNFRGTTFLTQTVARRMVRAGRPGSIYTVTSVNALRPGLGLSVYGATKGALETLMKGVALELAPHGIRVNTLALGAFATDMTRAVQQDPARLRAVQEGIPLGRFGQPEEVAAIVADLLASGSYLTGASLTLDGGMLLMRGYGKPGPYASPDADTEH